MLFRVDKIKLIFDIEKRKYIKWANRLGKINNNIVETTITTKYTLKLIYKNYGILSIPSRA